MRRMNEKEEREGRFFLREENEKRKGEEREEGRERWIRK